MTSSFQLGFNENPEEQQEYSSQEQALEVGNSRGKLPYTSVVLPTIFHNTETMGAYGKGIRQIDEANQAAIDNNEQLLSPEELKAKYPTTKFNGPMFAETAEHIAQRQARLSEVERIKEASTVTTPGAMFVPEIASYIGRSFTDPTEIGLMLATGALAKGATALFPALTKFTGNGIAHKLAGQIIPQNALVAEMSMANLPFSVRTAGRFYEGFMENAISNAVVEPWMASSSKRLGDDYTAANSLMNIFVGGLTGAVFHTGLGLMADPFTRMKTENKLQTAADYIALRQVGEDGTQAHIKNLTPATSLSARDVITNSGIRITETKDGQYKAHFTGEQGTLRNHEGIIGKTPADATRNLQYTYATVMQDGVLFKQLNELYNNKSTAKEKGIVVDPFKDPATGIKALKNSGTVVKGGIKHKIQFDSFIDKAFYNIHKILNTPANKGKDFANITMHKDLLDSYVKWLTTNVGDTTEADIKHQSSQVFKAVHNQIKENLNSKTNATDIKIVSFIKNTDLDTQPSFLSKEAWVERLGQQQDILNGTDKQQAVGMLEDLYKADLEVQKMRLDKLQESRAQIQKLISATDEQVRTFSEREQSRKAVIDSIKATDANIDDAQLGSYLYMLDVVTGNFAKWVKDHNISFVSEKEFQVKAESRLNQLVETKPGDVRTRIINNGDLALEYYTLSPEQLAENSYTVTSHIASEAETKKLLLLKLGKDSEQEHLFNPLEGERLEVENEAFGDIDKKITDLDNLIQNSRFKEDTVLYRGLPTEGAESLLYNDVKPGMVIQSKGYLGVTGQSMIAMGFALGRENTKPTILKVKVPKGSFGLDVESSLSESLRHSRYKEFLNPEVQQAMQWDDNFKAPKGFDDEEVRAMSFLLSSGIEDEVLLPRDLALKVLNVEEHNGIRYVDVTPDGSLNNIYGNNIARDNVDILFQKTNQAKEAFYNAIHEKEIGSPEHYEAVKNAFNEGAPIPQQFIDMYPDLRITQELANELPAEWLFQAAERRPLANRIIGEIAGTFTYPQFENLYGQSFVYHLGGDKFTRHPDIALAKTGKAVLFDIGDGIPHKAPLNNEFAYEDAMQEAIKWEPSLREVFEAHPEQIEPLVHKIYAGADQALNKKGLSFQKHIQSLGGKKRDVITRLDVADGELVFSMRGKDEIKQIGEPTLLKGMKPEDAVNINPEAIYKAILSDEIHKVEIAQKELIQAKKVQAPAPENSNELVKPIETITKKTKKLKESVEKAKKERKAIIEKVNESQPTYNKVIKGALDVSNENQYVVGLFKHADLSTLVHETAHIFRRTVLDPDILEQAEVSLGVKDGKWTTEAEEQFATGFEKYLAEGKTNSKGLSGLFEEFKGWLTDIYIKLTQAPTNEELSPGLRKVFDELFSERRVQMAEEAGFRNEDLSKAAQLSALSAHKDMLGHVNSSIKSLQQTIREGINPDSNAYERLRQQKLERIRSKKDMLGVASELTPDEIKTKAIEERRIIASENAQKAQLADGQFEKSKQVSEADVDFFENDLALEETSFLQYAKALGLSDEQLLILQEGLDPDLRLDALNMEAEDNHLIENVLKEFSECARGETNG